MREKRDISTEREIRIKIKLLLTIAVAKLVLDGAHKHLDRATARKVLGGCALSCCLAIESERIHKLLLTSGLCFGWEGERE